jgi:hypothetical protein
MALDLKRVASSAIEAAFDQSSPEAVSPRRRHPLLKTVALGAGLAAAARLAARRGPDLWQTVATEYTRLRDEIEDPPDDAVEYDELEDEDEELDDEDVEDEDLEGEDLEDEEDLEEATR